MLLNLLSLLHKMRLKAPENQPWDLSDCVACRSSLSPGTERCSGEINVGSPSLELSYLNEILLFFFSTSDGLLDGFRFSQDSLSFIQFVAALSIRHFLIDSRKQSMGKVRQR